MAERLSFVPSYQVDRGTFERFQESIPLEWIQQALMATDTASVRSRRLPAELVVWLVVGIALFRDLPIDFVVRELGLFLGGEKPPAKSAISAARARVGPAPLRALFECVGEAWAHQSAQRHAWRGLAVYGVDGSSVRVPDSVANREHFGGRRNQRGDSGYPLCRLVTLMALRSHLLAAARLGPYTCSELALASELWAAVPDDSLCVVDRGFFVAEVLLPLQSSGTNRHWLTRAKKNTAYTVVERLPDGTELVEMKVSHAAREKNPELPKTWRMRAIPYRRRGFGPQMLLTSLLDVEQYPAKEVVALYHERWELELGYDEVKTEMLEREEAIRSQTVAGVEQELWGVLLAYNLIRYESERVAEQLGVPPARISFVAALRHIRVGLIRFGIMSPGVLPKRIRELEQDLRHFVLPPRRSERAYPRAVKIKMSHYARKRPLSELNGRLK